LTQRLEENANEMLTQQQYLNCQETVAVYQNKIAEEQVKLDEIEETIKKFERQILNQKRTLGGVNAVQETKYLVNKKIKILENRLNRTTQKYNSVVTQNTNLNRDIESLHRESSAFEGYFHKHPKEIQKGHVQYGLQDC